jgi:hypothetical protein
MRHTSVSPAGGCLTPVWRPRIALPKRFGTSGLTLQTPCLTPGLGVLDTSANADAVAVGECVCIATRARDLSDEIGIRC